MSLTRLTAMMVLGIGIVLTQAARGQGIGTDGPEPRPAGDDSLSRPSHAVYRNELALAFTAERDLRRSDDPEWHAWGDEDRWPDVTRYAPRWMLAAQYLHVFRPYLHDDRHRTMSSKAVIPTGFLDIRASTGPMILDIAQRRELSASAAGMVSPSMALGCTVTVTRVSRWIPRGYPSFYDDIDQREWNAGVLMDVFHDGTLRVREQLLFGSLDVSEGDVSDSEPPRAIVRFRHGMDYAASSDVAYAHILEYSSTEDEGEELLLANRVEFAPSVMLTLSPEATLRLAIPESGSATTELDIGLGVAAYPGDTAFLFLHNRYTVAFEKSAPDGFAFTARGGVRF